MSKIRTAVTAAILLWMSLAFPNTQSAWAGDDKAVADKTADTAKKDSDTPKKDGDKTPSSTEVSKATSAPASAVEGEIQQLREALSEQQALLQTQQARIVQLENQLHVGQGQPVALASGTASGAAAIAGVFLFLGRPSLLLIFVVLVPLQLFRMGKETKVLEAKFGDEYRNYRRTTWF